jgi:hypothetical protein
VNFCVQVRAGDVDVLHARAGVERIHGLDRSGVAFDPGDVIVRVGCERR